MRGSLRFTTGTVALRTPPVSRPATREWRIVILVITNTDAGSAEASQMETAMAALGDDAELRRCSNPEELDAALDLGHRTIAAAGGDGSLHILANALYRRGELADRTVGLIPMGTGNDFARTLRIPLSPIDAVAAFLGGVTRPLDLIVDDTGMVIVNAVTVGVGADLTRAAGKWKRLLGPASFPVGGLIAGLAARGYRLRVEADGEVLIDTDHKVLMVGLANGRYIGGGAALLDPEARPGSGLINLMVSRSRGVTARVLHGIRLHRGTHPLEIDVHRRRAAIVRVSGEPSSTSADGELEDGVTDRTWRVLPGAWNFVVPRAYADEASS